MHTLLDYDGHLPAYVNITYGKTADNKGTYEIPLLIGSVIVADRIFIDFSLLNVWDSKGGNFVIRHEENLQFTTIKENELPENRHSHILKDEIIVLKNEASLKKYPDKLRQVIVWDDLNKLLN